MNLTSKLDYLKLKQAVSIFLFLSLVGCNSTQPTRSTKDSVIKTNSPSTITSALITKENKVQIEKATEQETIIEAINIIDSFKAVSSKKHFVKEYTYKAGEDDSKNTARKKALIQLKILLVEEIGTYIESELNIQQSIKSGHALNEVKKEIRTISAGITQTKILDQKWDGSVLYLKASVAIDPNSVTQGISEVLKSRANRQEIGELRLILKDKSSKFSLQSQQLKSIQNKLATQEFIRKTKENELVRMKDELSKANILLSKYHAEENKITTRLHEIKNIIRQKTDKVMRYVERGMVYTEMVELAGEPRSSGYAYPGEKMYNYGTVWVQITDGVVGCITRFEGKKTACKYYGSNSAYPSNYYVLK
ncbi:hypothetical protein ACMAZF_06700 [Psychrobium sp. nBUS_13]|uniref:hypothetical protein n=1 Tax=Psychrobium sp. nBUS_13 TaxID=3395319 RepID=UPI003EBCEDF3